MQSAPPLRQRVVSQMRFAFVFVETAAAFATEHLPVAQPKQNRGNVIATPVCLLQCIANINCDIEANFVDQSQRAHRHTPLQKRVVDLSCVQTALEKFRRIEQIGKQNPVDEKPRAVADDHR